MRAAPAARFSGGSSPSNRPSSSSSSFSLVTVATDYVSEGRLALMLGMYQKEGLGRERATVERRRRQAVGGTNEAGV